MMEERDVSNALKRLRWPAAWSAKEWMQTMPLENYHCHKDFSNGFIVDCAESIENYAKRSLEYGSQCLFSGDHGSQGNQFHVWKIAQQYGLKYRHSAEAYFVKDRKAKDRTNCHIMIVAKNSEGRKDLNYILSMANIDGYYYMPRIDLELLLSVNPENFIVTSACIAGWKYKDSESIWLQVAEHFGDNFFLEVQCHDTEAQKTLNRKILALADRHNLQLIAGLDTHFLTEASATRREQIQIYKHIIYNEDEAGWFMDWPDSREVYARFEKQGVLPAERICEAMMNTGIFVDQCSEIELDRHFKIPNVYRDLTYEQRVIKMKRLLNEAYRADPLKSREKKEGIIWETDQYVQSGTVDYPLLSREIVNLAQSRYGGDLTRTSRGSAASFYTNKCMNLTTVDRFNSDIPIYPERFLTKERIMAGTLPDVDLNIAVQEPFVKAARDLLGEHGCYPLMTLSKLKEKAAWQLYAGSQGVSPATANIVSKSIDAYNKERKHADEEDLKFIQLEDFIPAEYIEIYRKSLDYQGITIGFGTHACGHLIFDGDIRREIGITSAINMQTGKRTLVAAVEGKYLDEFGYVKEDFLIVDTVSLISKLFKSINEPVPSFEELKKMVDGDEPTWQIYEKGITCCVNQCEKEATRQKLMRYKPRSIGELSAFIAAIRPGFASLVDHFLARKPYTTGEDRIDKLLEDSSHYMIYQESIMKVLSFLKVPMTETYQIIKSISKKKLVGEKKQKLMEQLEKAWMNEFGNMDNFSKIWKVIEDAAAYAFNSPHSYSMAGDSLYLAWFKAHHTDEFYETAIRHYEDKNSSNAKHKITALLKEAVNSWGYQIGDYRFGKDNRSVNIDRSAHVIYPSLASIKGFGQSAADGLYSLGTTPPETFPELAEKLKGVVNTSQTMDLIKVGYFSCYGSAGKLEAFYRRFTRYAGRSQLGLADMEQLGMSDAEAFKYGKRTAKRLTEFDSRRYLQDYMNSLPEQEPDVQTILREEHRVFGSCRRIDASLLPTLFFCEATESKGKIELVSLYQPCSGRRLEAKIWESAYTRSPVIPGFCVTVPSLVRKPRKQFTGQYDEDGKRIYKSVPGQYEYWLRSYTSRYD